MSRHTRSRQRTRILNSGTSVVHFRDGSTSTSTSTKSVTEHCSDSVGSPIVDSAFNCTSYDGAYPSWAGQATPTASLGDGTYTVFDNYSVTGNPTLPAPLSAPSGWELTVVSRSNPSRPVTNLPIWTQNIVELPKMIQQLGSALAQKGKQLGSPKELANLYLSYKFGWDNLKDDLLKLLDAQSYMIKRSRELDQLYSGKGARGYVALGSDSLEGTPLTSTVTVYPTGWISAKAKVHSSRSCWGTTRWSPTTPPPYHTSDEKNNFIFRQLVLGLSPEGFLKGAWDVMPWTWLFGWFNNLGAYTLAHSWTVPATHSSCCFMSKVETRLTADGSDRTYAACDPSGVTYGGSLTITQSTRSVGSGSILPGFSMPLFDMGRLATLGSLAVQRFF